MGLEAQENRKWEGYGRSRAKGIRCEFQKGEKWGNIWGNYAAILNIFY